MGGRGGRRRQGLCEGNAREGLSQRPRDGRRLSPIAFPGALLWVAGKGGRHGASALFAILRSSLWRSHGEVAARSADGGALARGSGPRSEEHTSELQSLMRISYAVFC